MASAESIGRFAVRMAHVLRTNGPGALLYKIRNRLSPRTRAYHRHKAEEDARFDAAGYDTGGVQHLYGMEIVGGNAASGGNHIAIGTGAFERAMAAIDIPYEGFTFIDLGSGKGRAVLMAAERPFAKAIGVEFAAELHRVAEANLATRERLHGPDPRIEFHHQDATEFAFPDDPTILFFFNPFDPPVLTDVIDNATESLRRSPRPFRLVYVIPTHLAAWQEAGWRLLKQEGEVAVFAPPADLDRAG